MHKLLSIEEEEIGKLGRNSSKQAYYRDNSLDLTRTNY